MAQARAKIGSDVKAVGNAVKAGTVSAFCSNSPLLLHDKRKIRSKPPEIFVGAISGKVEEVYQQPIEGANGSKTAQDS